MLSMKALYITQSHRLQTYPTDGSVKHLTIDGTALLEDLLSPLTSLSLVTMLATTKSLVILGLGDCFQWFADAVVLDVLFAAIRSMDKLQRLTLEHFSLPDPASPPPAPPCLVNTPLCVKNLVLINTHAESLTFLLDLIAVDHLSLQSCSDFTELPDCDQLSLFNIPDFQGLIHVLVGWEGKELEVTSCPFFDRAFNTRLKQVMMNTGKPIWKNVNFTFTGYSCAVRAKVREWEDLRLRLLKKMRALSTYPHC